MSQVSRPVRAISEFERHQILSLIHRTISRFDLELTGLNVVAPAVSGFESATATIALLAGAQKVTAIAFPSTRHRSVEDSIAATSMLAELAGVKDDLVIGERLDHGTCTATNILVNSAPIAPITRSVIERLPRAAVIALMTEAWRVPPGEVDIDACRDHGISVSAVNERHPTVGGSQYQAALCLRLLEAANVVVPDSMIALICDNPLADRLDAGLRTAGAQVVRFSNAETIFSGPWNAIVLAQQPTERPQLGIHDLAAIAKVAPEAVIVQYWGDIDRIAARYFGLKVWPRRTPGKGQMGMALEELGPEPTISLITGGLKAAQMVLTGAARSPDDVAQVVLRREG